MSEDVSRRLLVLLVVAFFVLGVTYHLATPVFEAPDESSHLTLVRYLATNRALPPLVVPDHRRVSGADVAQSLTFHDPPLYCAPPLYYGLGALLTAWADMTDLPALLIPSPSWEAGYAPQADTDPWNKNVYVHLTETTLARSGTMQAALALRVISLMLGAVTVVSTHALARVLWPDRPALALGAAAFVALNPEFIAISTGVTNDNLLNALFSLCLVFAARWMRRGARWPRWALLGCLVGAALLTKQSALLLLPLGLLAAVWQPHGGSRLGWLWAAGAFLAAALGIGG